MNGISTIASPLVSDATRNTPATSSAKAHAETRHDAGTAANDMFNLAM
jgi:hypothetical protein